MSTNGRVNVQISDYSDREILLMILDLGGEVSTPDLAARIFGAADPVHGNRCVSARLSWMRRFGLTESWVEVNPPKTRTWKVSSLGVAMTRAQLRSSLVSVVNGSPEEYSLSLANLVGEKLVAAGDVASTAMRREFQFQINRRKRGR